MDDGSYRIIMPNKKVVIFGVFDGIHEGHLAFIKEAKKQGNNLVAIVARDEMVQKLKGKIPKYNEVERINSLFLQGIQPGELTMNWIYHRSMKSW